MEFYRDAYSKVLTLNDNIKEKNTIAFTDFAWIAHTFFTNKDYALELYPMLEDEFNELIVKSQRYYGMK